MTEQAPGTGDSGANTVGAFPIVGIGASAGGLAMFEAFFSALPAGKTGIAFVVVQHLARDHKSILAELIARHTNLPVFEVEDGVKVEPDCAYIIPPGRDMVLVNGTLQLFKLGEHQGKRGGIDFFFQSLAEELRERAIGIILSGSGSDGSQGVRAIKAAGGMVMAQNPANAEFDGMPRSAIATGLVDFELNPDEMPAVLISYIGSAYAQPDHSPKAEVAFSPGTLHKIFVLLRAQTRHDFSQYKIATIQRRIERRMALHQVASLDDYAEFLRETPAEIDALFRDLLIGVTNFFRDPAAFASLERDVIPRLFANKGPGGTVRVWVPGCSTGDEAYSIAILIDEYAQEGRQNMQVQIFATDIDSQAIATARSGIFPVSITKDVSPARLARYFSDGPEIGSLRIHKRIRDMLVFSEQDLVRDPPFSKLDLISCRNLLIYLEAGLQKRIIPLFHFALNPDGYLFLGTSESIGDFTDLFAPIDRKQKTFLRKSPVRRTRFGALNTTDHAASMHGGDRLATIPAGLGPAGLTLRALTEKMLLQHFAAVGALVTAQGDIMYLHGRSGLFLEPQSGESAIGNIFKMAREGLERPLVLLLREAIETRGIIRKRGVMVKTNGDFSAANITIRPLQPTAFQVPLFLVILEKSVASDGEAEVTPGETPTVTAVPEDSKQSVAALRNELSAKEQFLETTIEALAASNEELKSYNEELQSVNEELQSTNEELNTAQEELQSVNEELATVNSELQDKNTDLARANNDLNNLLAGTKIGTIFVDLKLNLMRFTPAATEIINLIEGDIGRPLHHISTKMLSYKNLERDISEVLNTLQPQETDVQVTTGAWYTMRILPYRTTENAIQGAVVTFVDISAMKTSQEALRLTEERIRVALLSAPITVFNQDLSLRYTWIHSTNPSLRPEQILGKTDLEIFAAADAKLITALKQQVLKTGTGLRQRITSAAGALPHEYDLTIEPLRNSTGEIIGITSATIDLGGGANL